MNTVRQVGVVFLLDRVVDRRSASPRTARLPLTAEHIGPIVRMIERRAIPACFASVDPLNHPWTTKLQRLPFVELALLVPRPSRTAWSQAAVTLEQCRDAGLELHSGVLCGSPTPGGGQRLMGLDAWAYWLPESSGLAWVQPWRDGDCWQIPLNRLRRTSNRSATSAWWRAGRITPELVIPGPGRRATWVVPLESADATKGGPCDMLVRQMYQWMRQGVADVESLSQIARRLNSQGQPPSQTSILRAA